MIPLWARLQPSKYSTWRNQRWCIVLVGDRGWWLTLCDTWFHSLIAAPSWIGHEPTETYWPWWKLKKKKQAPCLYMTHFVTQKSFARHLTTVFSSGYCIETVCQEREHRERRSHLSHTLGRVPQRYRESRALLRFFFLLFPRMGEEGRRGGNWTAWHSQFISAARPPCAKCSVPAYNKPHVYLHKLTHARRIPSHPTALDTPGGNVLRWWGATPRYWWKITRTSFKEADAALFVPCHPSPPYPFCWSQQLFFVRRAPTAK